MINGRVFDWESIKIQAPFGLNLEILAISYSSEAPVTPAYGRGIVARGYGQGNLVQEGSFEIPHNAFQQLQVFAATKGGVLRIPPFPIVVSYANADQVPQVDVLRSCKIEKVETSASQGDAEVGKRTITIKILDPILYNAIPAA
jgi:hypothetical protein